MRWGLCPFRAVCTMSSRCTRSSSRKQHLDWIKIDPHKCRAVPTPSSSCTTLRKIDLRKCRAIRIPVCMSCTTPHALKHAPCLSPAQPLRKIDLHNLEPTLTPVSPSLPDVRNTLSLLRHPFSFTLLQPLRKIDLCNLALTPVLPSLPHVCTAIAQG